MAHSSPYPILLLATVVVFTLYTLAQNTGNITVGTSLTATEDSNPWLSPSGDFAFGFQQLPDNRDLFVLSIWFDKIPDRTIVWYEKRSYPVPRGSEIRLDAGDGLILQDPQGRLLYNTSGLADEVAYAFMNDTGNFVLLRSDSSVLWESFRYPADTILPTQTIEIDGMLISRKTATNFSQGRFYAIMNSDGDFVLNTKSAPSNLVFDDEYYSSFTSEQNASSSGFRLVFNESTASIFILRRNGERQTLTPRSIPPPSDNYYRSTLDFDGVFTQYYHPKNFGSNPQWAPANSWPVNICLNIDGDKGSGACGYNSVCSLKNQRPFCQCPPRFSLADPNNTYGDCNPNYVKNCIQGETGSAEDEYDLLQISDIDWPRNDYEQISPSTEEECERNCLNDCFCAVAIYRSNSCWKKKLPLSNGRVDKSLGVTAFLKLRKELNDSNACLECRKRGGQCGNNSRNEFLCTHEAGNRKLRRILLAGGVSVTALSATFLILFIFFQKKYILAPKWPIIQKAERGSDKEIELFFKNNGNLSLRKYKYSDLKNMTKSFSDKLGKGGYGTVYKGKLSDGRLVAVKILNELKEDGQEFMNELASISRTSHINIVTLLGFCYEGSKRALIYDFMPNGSLEKFIKNTTSSLGVLGWKKLFEIAVGIARGLEYLHQGCNTRILHFDIKPHNILLDKDFNPKISDFGLAKLCPNRSSIVSMLVARGTIGYIAPELFSRSFGEVSHKSDVYSYGMMILEVAGERKDIDRGNIGHTSEMYFPQYIYKQLEVDADMDDSLDGIASTTESQSTKRKLIIVGLWCVQPNPNDRPSMTKVIEMLDGKLESLQVPPKPYLFSPSRPAPQFSTSELHSA